MGPTDASLLISRSFGCPGVKHSTMSIRSYFMVKQRDPPEMETVVSSSVAEAVRTKVKRTIGVKHAIDEEGDLSESKRGAYEKIHIYITNIVHICNINW